MSPDSRVPPPVSRPPSGFAEVVVELRDGRLRFAGLGPGQVELLGAVCALVVRRSGRRLEWRAPALVAEGDAFAAEWPVTGLRVELRCEPAGEAVLVRATLEHRGDAEVAVETIAPLSVEPPGEIRVGASAADWAVFRNGYQSWSGTRAYGVADVDADPWWTFLRTSQTDVRHPAAGRAGIVRSDLLSAIVNRRTGEVLGVGFLDARDYFGAVTVDARGGRARRLAAEIDGDGVALRPGERLALPPLWVGAGFDGQEILGAVAAALGAAMRARVGQHVPVGWCSWYYYFTGVREADVIDNLAALQRLRERLPCDYVMIDDGWQRAVGDWFEANAKFPHGMRWLAQEIRAAGFDAGLWLAPFIARPESRLYRERPEWFVRTRRGRPRSAVWNPVWSLGRSAYALDTTHPAVIEWLAQLARTAVHQWGYRVLKLDFLFAAALPGVRHDPQATRAQALRRGVQAIRDGAGEDAFLLGCGCPLGPAVGLVDGMRIGADVAPFWSNWISRRLLRDRHGVATKNAVRNTLTRAFLHRRLWLNDPDCLMVRDTRTRLTLDEVRSLAAVVGLTDGMFVVSDRMDQLPEERLAILDEASGLTGGVPSVVDLFERDIPELVRCTYDDGEVVAVFNFSDRPVDKTVDVLPSGVRTGEVRELWSGRPVAVHDGRARLGSLPPHACRLLWVERNAPPAA